MCDSIILVAKIVAGMEDSLAFFGGKPSKTKALSQIDIGVIVGVIERAWTKHP